MRETMAKLLMLVLLLSVRILYAGSTTWKLNPTSNDWNTAENWTPETIPSSETDVATFSASNTTNLICGDAPGGEGTSTIVGDVVFTEGAGAYTITITPVFDNIFPSIIEFHRGGITNNSGVVQNFVAANSGTTKASGRIYFMNSASAGENVVITNEGGASATGDGVYGGFTQFWYSSNAGSATFISNGGTVDGARGGFTWLIFDSSAESATFISNPGEVSGAAADYSFAETRGAASATPPTSPIPPLCQAPRELGPKSTRARQRALPSLPTARQLRTHKPAKSMCMEGVATPPSPAMAAGGVAPKEACSIFSLCLPLMKQLSYPRTEPTVAWAGQSCWKAMR